MDVFYQPLVAADSTPLLVVRRRSGQMRSVSAHDYTSRGWVRMDRAESGRLRIGQAILYSPSVSTGVIRISYIRHVSSDALPAAYHVCLTRRLSNTTWTDI